MATLEEAIAAMRNGHHIEKGVTRWDKDGCPVNGSSGHFTQYLEDVRKYWEISIDPEAKSIFDLEFIILPKEKNGVKYYPPLFQNTHKKKEKKISKDKLWSLKYAIDACEKGFEVEYANTGLIFSPTLILNVFTDKTSTPLFKILPKKEKVKKFQALFLYNTGVLDTTREKFYNKEEAIEYIKDSYYSVKFIKFLDEYPEHAPEEVVEVQYDPKSFGDVEECNFSSKRR